MIAIAEFDLVHRSEMLSHYQVAATIHSKPSAGIYVPKLLPTASLARSQLLVLAPQSAKLSDTKILQWDAKCPKMH